MRRPGLTLLVVTVIMAVTLGSATAAQDAGSGGPVVERPTFRSRVTDEAAVVPGRLIVKYEEDASSAEQAAVLREEGLKKKSDLNLIDADAVKVRGQSVREAIEDLEDNPDVEYVEPDRFAFPFDYRGEPRFSELWGLHNTGQKILRRAGKPNVDINALQASKVTQGSEDVVVAVIDDGVDFSHPDLEDRAWKNPGESGGGKETNGVDDDNNGYVDDVNGWDFYNKDNGVHDRFEDFHGTHVAGTLAASVNDKGVVGVAPNVKIMALKWIGPDGGRLSRAIKAIEYAKKEGARISNNSWGYYGWPSRALKEAIKKSGMLFVAAAGNGGSNGKGDNNDTSRQAAYPASYDLPNILSVAAANNQGKLARFSNYGRKSVDITAPGVDVLSSVPVTLDEPGVTLSSVAGGGKALTVGFGVEEIDGTVEQAAFMESAFDAVGWDSAVPSDIVLVDDDRSNSGGTIPEEEFFPDVGPTISAAIEGATGVTPQVIEVGEGEDGPDLSALQGKTVVWATGWAFSSNDPMPGDPFLRNLTRADRATLTSFLQGGGKLVITGMDALHLTEEASFVLDVLQLDVRFDYPTTTFTGEENTAFAGEFYDLTSDLAIPFFHDILRPLGPAAAAQGVIGAEPYEYFSGTSMAAAHATGTAALVASESPNLLGRPRALKKVIMENGKPLRDTRGKTVTSDLVDAEAAVTRGV